MATVTVREWPNMVERWRVECGDIRASDCGEEADVDVSIDYDIYNVSAPLAFFEAVVAMMKKYPPRAL